MFEAFQIGSFLIWTRLVFLLVAVWMATEFFIRLSRSAHLSLETFRNNKWSYLIAFLLMGRVVAILTEYKVYLRDPLRVFIFWDGGFSFLGAVFGIACVLFWYTRLHRTTFLQWLDILTPAAMFGLAFDWIGKFAAGHAYGSPTDVWWGITYEVQHVRYTAPVHPVQIYYALFFFFLTFLLLIIRKRSKRAGSETLWGIILAAVATFFFDAFRGDIGIIVFATQMDFVVLFLLFLNLGILTLLESRISSRAMMISESTLIGLFLLYFFARPWLAFDAFELRFSQFLAILSFCAILVYVIVHRQKYPHL